MQTQKIDAIKFMKVYAIAFVLFAFLLVPAMWVMAHNKGTYPTVGHLWMSSAKNYSGLIYVTSTSCNADETSAYSRVKNSTTGTTEMANWPNGIQMSQYTCTGAWNNSTDIRIEYVASQSSPGLNVDTARTPSYCSFWNTTHPCGVRSNVSIRQSWWNGASSLSRQRLVMHETGHSLGLGHLCTQDSIMNDGRSGCNGGKWTGVMVYKPVDRAAINNVY